MREPSARVTGNGSGAGVAASEVLDVETRFEHGVTVVEAGTLRMTVARVIPTQPSDAAVASLRGTWPDHPEPTTLAEVIAR